ncbi:hypothetical protein DH2020_017774 [Rehmannia glutinosa]|uniref:Rubisco LSMT substrate-binding domain-containing protein n=1 Tax=Rehmannia glutinosa TaxID=99300 RepID=A0ABR0WSX6_REHGL
MAISVLHTPSYSIFSHHHHHQQQQWNAAPLPPIRVCKCRTRSVGALNAAQITNDETSSVNSSTFPLFQPPLPPPPTPASELELADPDFYKIGYVRSVRAYGIEFREGPDGFGVYASKDIEPLRRARVIMEIPLELMLTISQKLPWMFFPDIIPVGHPIFDIINSTNPETDWDLRLACLLLYAFDCKDNFWQLYGDFLPGADECTSFLLATEVRVMRGLFESLSMFTEDLLELQDKELASTLREQQQRALEFWEKNWPNCFFHWRFKDRMLEVMINAGQRIKKGDENPWDVIQFSGNARVHLDSFLSVFNISGLPEDYYHNSKLSNDEDNFVDGAVLAAARTIPTWSEGDIPPIPSMERKAVKELQEECQQMLAEFSTTAGQDQQILESMPEARRTHEAAIKYRLHRKLFIEKVIQALDIYQERILF